MYNWGVRLMILNSILHVNNFLLSPCISIHQIVWLSLNSDNIFSTGIPKHPLVLKEIGTTFLNSKSPQKEKAEPAG